MKVGLKEGFIVRKIVNDTVVMDTKDTARLLRLNETAAEILSMITEGLAKDEMVAEFLKKYEIDAETAEKDITATLENLKELGALEE